MHTKITPKDFFLWVGSMVALYGSVIAFISLIFDYINYAYPDAAAVYSFSGNPYASGISHSMAALIVLFPMFLVLRYVIRLTIKHDNTRADVWVRRWALYLTLFIAGATLVTDLIVLLMYFFDGDVTVRFIMKITLVILVAGGGFLHFLADLWRYWEKKVTSARVIGAATSILVLFTVFSAFMIIGTPWQARLYRLDDQKTYDLEQIQARIVTFWQKKGELPKALVDLNDSIGDNPVPTDPQTGEPYTYTVTGKNTFILCARFNALAQQYSPSVMNSQTTFLNNGSQYSSWFHGAGDVCFDRTIDPDIYPPRLKAEPVKQ